MSKIGTKRVPNEGPKDARIYFVGEAPGSDEVDAGRPFVGVSGTLLRDCLGRNGIAEASVRFANLCQYRPEDNKFANVVGSRELEAGIEELTRDLRDHRPNVVAALGAWPLLYLTSKRGKKAPGTGIIKWRGSILPCTLPGCEGIKVIPTFHPAFVVRKRNEYPIFDTDMKRIKFDSSFPELRHPEYKFTLNPMQDKLQACVEELLAAPYLAVDIESVKKSTHILCVSYSPSPYRSIVIPFSYTDFARVEAHQRLLTSDIPKVFHNAAFDIPMLALNGIKVKNLGWDTMFAQHAMWAELPKSLEYLTSVHTRQPYYKTEGRAEIPSDAKRWDEKFDRRALYEYNAKDTAVTALIYEAQKKEMDEGPPEWREIFDFELASLEVTTYLSLAGMPVDVPYKERLRIELKKRWAILQFILNQLTGFETNVNSTKAMPKILYDKDKMGLPARKNRQGNFTTDEDAIVSLIGFVKDKISKLKAGGVAQQYWLTRAKVLDLVLEIRGIRKLLSSYVNSPISEDGRVRGQYKGPVTDTGRWAAGMFFDGTGFNPQTVPREVFEIKDYAAVPALQDLMNKIDELEGLDRKEEEDASDEDADSSEAAA